MNWRVRQKILDLSAEGLIMGILNVTPDSFSDGGLYVGTDEAIAHGLEMLAEGAAIIDVGGESTRPGAAAVPEAEERARVVPVIQGILARNPDAVISVDTSKGAVARAAIDAGAHILNDVTGLEGDPEMMGIAAETGAGVVIMHMQGIPRTMQENPCYDDVVAEVAAYLDRRWEAAIVAGIDPGAIAVDPGIGFGKTLEHNLELLRHLETFTARGRRPLVLGVSRKSFLGKLTGSAALSDRLWPTVALTAWSRHKGALVHRVHDVKENLHALRMAEAILHAREPSPAEGNVSGSTS